MDGNLEDALLWVKMSVVVKNPLSSELKHPYGEEGKRHFAEKDAAEEDILVETFKIPELKQF